jgi:hypothetical protein
MATQNVTLDGATSFSAFGNNYFWNNRYIDSANLYIEQILTPETLNVSITGAAWTIRTLSFDNDVPVHTYTVNLSEANDGIFRRIDRIQLGDNTDATLLFFGTRVRFIEGGSDSLVDLTLGSGGLYFGQFWDALSATVTQTSGYIDALYMSNHGTNIFNGGSGSITFLELGEGINTFNGGTGNFGIIRAWGTNTMTFNEGGDTIVFGPGDTLITLNPPYSPNPARVASLGGFEAVGVLYPGL